MQIIEVKKSFLNFDNKNFKLYCKGVSLVEINPIIILSALIPLVILFFLMAGLKMNSRLAALLALLPAAALALSLYGLTPAQLFNALARGAAMSLFIVLIVSGAILLYNVVEVSGGFAELKNFFLAEKEQPGFWLLLFLSWVVSAFIQGVSGFGVPVAVVGSLLVGLGYNPLLALAAVLIGHSWSISFGSMGSSFYALNLVTGLPAAALGLTAVGLFLPTIWSTGLGVAWLYGGWSQVKRSAGRIFLLGAIMSGVQALMAGLYLPHLATFAAGFIGSICCLWFWRRDIFPETKGRKKPGREDGLQYRDIVRSLLPYFILLVIVPAAQLPPLQKLLAGAEYGFNFSGFITNRGYQVAAAENYAAINLTGHPFLLLMLSAFLGGFFLQQTGEINLQDWRKVFAASWQQLKKSALSILLLMLLAGVMNYSGMIYAFARGLAGFTGRAFPFFSPLIGVLGAFLTGSNTSSNVLFGGLQKEIARILEVSPLLLAAAQTVGGSLGSAVAPAKIVLGTATAGEEGSEGLLLRRCLGYTLLSAGLVGVITGLLTLML